MMMKEKFRQKIFMEVHNYVDEVTEINHTVMQQMAYLERFTAWYVSFEKTPSMSCRQRNVQQDHVPLKSKG